LTYINKPTEKPSIYYPSTNNACIKKQCAMKRVSFLQQNQNQSMQNYYKDYPDPYPEYNNDNVEYNENNVSNQLSDEEIKQKRLENYINYHMEKRRISQIKSRKLIIPEYRNGNINGSRIGVSRPNHRLNKMFGL